MALRRDYSQSKDLDIEANAEMIDCISENYASYKILGRDFKNLLQHYIAIYRGSCGEGETINNIYDLYASYSNMNITDDKFSFIGEASLVKDLFVSMDEYENELAAVNEELGRVIDGWLAAVNPSVLSPEQRRQDKNYVGQVEQILNRRLFMHETKIYLYLLMNGALFEGYPEEKSDPESMFTALDFPLMTHIPYCADIDKEECETSPVMQVLYNIVVKDSYFPMEMMHDYNNGNVCVRLWKEEDGEYVPVYYSIVKSEVFLDKISYLEQRAIWPGLIESALKSMGCDDSKEEIALAVLGPKLAEYSMDYLCGDKAIPQDKKIPRWFNNAIDSYVKCIYDAYASFLATNSLVVSDHLEYTKLMFGLREFMYALSCCYNESFELLKPALDLIKKLLSEYRLYASENEFPTKQIVSKRLSVCNTVDEILALYESDSTFRKYPHAYFEKFLAERIAGIILDSMNMERTQEALNAKTLEIMSDSIFKSKASKINVHVLRHPTTKLADDILAKMERR